MTRVKELAARSQNAIGVALVKITPQIASGMRHDQLVKAVWIMKKRVEENKKLPGKTNAHKHRDEKILSTLQEEGITRDGPRILASSCGC